MNWQKEHFFHEKNHWWFKSRRKLLRNILGKVTNSKKKSIIDLGCGNGTNLKYLFNKYRKKVGIELDSFSFKNAKIINPKAKILNFDLNEIDKIKEKFNLVSILDVLYHEDITDPTKLIEKAQNLNSVDDYLIISEPAFNILSGNHSKLVEEKRRFKKEQLEEIISSFNYKIVYSSYWGFSTFIALFLKRRLIEPIVYSRAKDLQSDLGNLSFFNPLLYFIMLIENSYLKYFKYPFGSSVVILAKKVK